MWIDLNHGYEGPVELLRDGQPPQKLVAKLNTYKAIQPLYVTNTLAWPKRITQWNGQIVSTSALPPRGATLILLFPSGQIGIAMLVSDTGGVQGLGPSPF